MFPAVLVPAVHVVYVIHGEHIRDVNVLDVHVIFCVLVLKQHLALSIYFFRALR
jgi:hypothetical protein